jgi:hypothetical protein
MNDLEKRMYFLVPYNISPIQQAIQAGHSMGEYALKYGRYDSDHLIWEFLEKWKTWIVLNGGTTSFKIIEIDGENQLTGTLNQIQESLVIRDIEHSTFIEPDLNDALTAVCLIVDERVFNREDYPNFEDWLGSRAVYITHTWDTVLVNEEALRIEYSEFLGGDDIVFLRDLLNSKKLA